MSDFPTIITTRRVVPNFFPIIEPTTYRMAFVGEAPGEDEENHLIPFVGKSGQFLDRIMHDCGIDRKQVFTGNVCQVRPPGNRIEAFDWHGPEIQDGITQLKQDLSSYAPNIIVALGATPLRLLLGQSAPITNWRGSLFTCRDVDPTIFGRKSIATLHPAGVLREFSGYPLLRFDIARARQEAETPTLILPSRDLLTNLSSHELCFLMDTWPTGQRCSLDIEGGLGGWPCVSLCSRPTRSVTIAFGRLDELGHARVLQSFARLMARADVPKVLQNSLYDNFVLSYGFGIPIRGVVEDTMLKGWEVYCELPKGLGTQASIWTREPFYKAERKSQDSETFFQYCAKDSAVTLEICNAQDSALEGTGLRHYRENMDMLQPLLYMELRGIRYDQENVDKRMREVRETGWTEEGKWNDPIGSIAEALERTAGKSLRGPKGSLVPQRLAKVLYEEKGYPKQFKKEEGRKTEKLTTDIEAILSLRRKLPGDNFLSGILRHRHLEGLLETLAIKPDEDGRVRCGYNVVGTETGRLTCYTSPTGAGANLQTITKSLRGNYCADSGCSFFQCDLEGADGWTVAAHCARLGDSTMLEDYRAKLKPAKIVALLYYFGAAINELSREDLKWFHDVIFPLVLKEVGKWLYLGCKRVQHGSNYLMGIPTMILNVIKDSFKESGTPVYLEHSVAATLQQLYFYRYPGIRLWHQWCESKLRADGQLTSASGHTRTFFGRRWGKDIHDTLKEFLADEPQQNTTYATNLAMLRLWNDPENRAGGIVLHEAWDTYDATMKGKPGALFVEPLHQVHDALCGQGPSTHLPWVGRKLRQWFNNPLTIAGIPITIPFDGAFGPDWGNLTIPI